MNNGDQDKLGRALGEGIGRTKPAGECIGPEDMAALAEGAITGDERNRLLDHIAACPDCREVYMLVAAVDEPQAVEAAHAPSPARARMRGRMLPLALAACLALVAVSVFEYMSGIQAPKETEQLMAKADAPASHKLGTFSGEDAVETKREFSRDEDYRYYGNESVTAEPETPPAPAPVPSGTELRGAYGGGPMFSDMPEKSPEPTPVPETDKDTALPSMTEMPVRERESAPSWGSQDAGEGYIETPAKSEPFAPEPQVAAEPALPPAEESVTRGAAEVMKEMPAGDDMGFSAGEAASGKPAVCRPGEKCVVETPADTGEAGTATPAETVTSTAQLKRVKGELKSIDFDKGEVVLRPVGENEDMKIMFDDPSNLKDIKVGDMVRIDLGRNKDGAYLAGRVKKERAITVPVGC